MTHNTEQLVRDRQLAKAEDRPPLSRVPRGGHSDNSWRNENKRKHLCATSCGRRYPFPVTQKANGSWFVGCEVCRAADRISPKKIAEMRKNGETRKINRLRREFHQALDRNWHLWLERYGGNLTEAEVKKERQRIGSRPDEASGPDNAVADLFDQASEHFLDLAVIFADLSDALQKS